jgi:hypothetical protein
MADAAGSQNADNKMRIAATALDRGLGLTLCRLYGSILANSG